MKYFMAGKGKIYQHDGRVIDDASKNMAAVVY